RSPFVRAEDDDERRTDLLGRLGYGIGGAEACGERGEHGVGRHGTDPNATGDTSPGTTKAPDAARRGPSQRALLQALAVVDGLAEGLDLVGGHLDDEATAA